MYCGRLVVFLLAQVLALVAASSGLEERQLSLNASATFIYGIDGMNFTFALTASAADGDIYFHMSAPAGNSWIAVGTGSAMAGSLMFVAYAGENGQDVTLSPRRAKGNAEPEHEPSVRCEVYNSDTLRSGVIRDEATRSTSFVVNAHCFNVKNAASPPLDFRNREQPWMFAVGPGDRLLASNAIDADIRRHDSYGRFWMDMAQATTPGFGGNVLPPRGEALRQTSGAGVRGQPTGDRAVGNIIHVFLACGAFAVIFPLGVVSRRLFGSTRVHYVIQILGILAALGALGSGVSLSKLYKKSRASSSGHQLLGILLICLVFIQALIGFVHHRGYKKSTIPSKWRPYHFWLGFAVIAAGMLNGFLGFMFAEAGSRNVPYAAVVIAMAVVLLGSTWYGVYRETKRRKAEEERKRREKAGAAAWGGPTTRKPVVAHYEKRYLQKVEVDASVGRPEPTRKVTRW